MKTSVHIKKDAIEKEGYKVIADSFLSCLTILYQYNFLSVKPINVETTEHDTHFNVYIDLE